MASPLILKSGRLAEQTVTDPIEIPGKLSFGQGLNPPIINVSQNNYNPNGLSSTILLLLSSSVNINITGLMAPSPKSTQLIAIFNIGSKTISIIDNSSSSDPDNRFNIGTSKNLQHDEGLFLIYNDINSKWLCPATNL
jgi:hypothetical protein